MSTLYLIRHGQASWMSNDYDVLSRRGVEQSRRLGAYLARSGLQLDAVYTGPRMRQIDTAQHMIDAARGDGLPLPAAERLDAFDEFPFESIVKEVLPGLTAADPELAAILSDPARRARDLARAIEQITGRWSRGHLAIPDHIESYDSFRGRVVGGMRDVMRAQGRGKTVAIVTSGGPISIAMRHALGLDHEVTWKTAWLIRNASITEFLYRDEHELSFVAFNSLPHLPPGELITYR